MKSQRLAALILSLLITVAISQLTVERTYLPFPRTAASSIQIENKIYFPGGYENDDLIATDKVDIYNMNDKRWETPLKLPQARAFVSPATSGNYLYLVGGFYTNNCVKIYSTEDHNYTMLPECGPTVRSSKQVSRHNDMLTLLGAFSADFFDMTNNTWSHSETLTSWMRSIVGGITLVHEDVVIGIGGVNRTTLEPFFGAWTFNVTMNKLTIRSDVLNRSISNVDFKFSVAHNILSVWTVDRCFLHSLQDSEWYEESAPSIIRAATLGHETFIVSLSQLMIFDWTFRTSNSTMYNPGNFIDVFTVNNQLVIIELNQLAIYDSVSWTYISAPSFMQFAPFFDNYILYAGATYHIYIYNSTDKSINMIQQQYQGVLSFIAIDASTFVAFTGVISIVIENGIEINSTETETTLIGQLAIGRDIIDFKNNKIWVNLTTLVSTDPFVSALVWTPDGSAAATYPQQTSYPFIDVIDHTTGELVSSLPFVNITFGITFAQVIVFPDTIAVIPRGPNAYFYNFTSGNTKKIPKLASVQSQQAHFNPPVIDGVGYSMASVSTVQQIRSNTISAFLSGQQDIGSIYQMLTTDTMIYFSILANTDNLIHSIYSYNATTHDDSSWQLFGVPEPQSALFFAASNDLLLVFGPNSTQLQYLYTPEPIEWKSVPFSYSFVPAIVRTLRDSTVLIAGGTHPVYGFYSNEVLLLNSTGLLPSSAMPDPSVPSSVNPSDGLTTGELAAAIVVPIVVVIAAGVVLIVLLLRRNKRKNSNGTTTIGLASKYGDWFVPFDQLLFEEQLGQGSSGQVFKGKWNNTVVALKVIMTQANSSVIGELELMMQMRPHPNVVQLFGFSVHPETQSIILIIEYCDGGSLQTILVDSSVEISSVQQHEWIAGVAKGLSHLHSHNIVHRDIAARNVLLNHGEPKLTDFGMSRIVDEVNVGHGTTKSELGPIRWMAPESLKSKQYSTKSDVWSFGILMFEIIARQEPHVTVDPIQVGLMIRDQGLTPVIPSECPTELAELMRGCWNVSPQSRPEIETIVKKLNTTSFS